MTDENIFENSECDIEAVPVVDFDFIPADIVCESIPTPAPIFSCVAPVIVPEPPTDVGIDCPVFTATSKIEVGYPGNPADSECAVEATPYATLQITKTSVDPCDYEINLDINVPIPKPPCQTTLQGGTFNANVGYQECVPPGASIQINRVDVPGDCDTPDECQYTIDLDIGIPIPRVPCPELRISNFTSTSGYEGCVAGVNRFDIIPVHREPNGCDDPGQCAFEFDLQIAVPIPEPPCPTISVTNFVTSSSFAGPIVDESGTLVDTNCIQPNKFEISVTQTPATCDTPPQCDFGINLEIFVPIPRTPCPVISINSFSVQSGYEYCLVEPENKFTITQRHVPPASCQDPGTCAFDLDLQIAVPIPDPPCPIVLPGELKVVTGFAGAISYKDENDNDVIVAECAGGENKLTVTSNRIPATCDTPAQCEFQLGLDIFVPVPRIPCPTIQTGEVNVISGYDICIPEVENKLEIIPRHIPPQNCDDPGTCAFDVNLQIGIPIPTPVCPILSVNTAVLNSGFTTLTATENKDSEQCDGSSVILTVTQEITPADCDKAPECSFALDFEANVFIPRTPCPVLNVTDVIVRTGYLYEADLGEDCKATENRLSIVPTHTEGLTCDDPGQCSFDIELEINVPIPKPPCPTINVQKFSVVSGFPQCIQDKQNIFKITTDHRDSENCNDPGQCTFNLELELAVPIPEPNCPNIYVSSVQTRSGFISAETTPDGKACQTGSTLTVTKTETKDCNGAPRCEFAVDFDLSVFIPRVPCPNITVDSFKVATAFEGCPTIQGGNIFRIDSRPTPGASCDDPGFCEFGVTLEIAVPLPRPVCPNFYVKEFVVNTKIQSSTQNCTLGPSVFQITPKVTQAACPTQQPTCEFETTLQLNVPIPEVPCPQIRVGNFVVKSGFNTGGCDVGDNVFKITTTETGGSCTTQKQCAYDLDLEIYIPVPKPKCPEIKVGSFSVKSGFSGEDCETGENRFTVEKIISAEGDCDTPEECEFYLNLDIAVPVPPPKCPTIFGRSVVDIQSSDTITEASGEAKLTVQTGLGCAGNPEASCDAAPECYYGIVLVLDLEIPSVCDPKLVVNSVKVDSGYDKPTFFIATATYSPRPECLLELDMDLSINIPRPPCPDIIAQVNLVTLPAIAQPYANINVASVKVPGEYCSYDILLNLGIPDNPPCPQFLPAVVDAAWSNGNVPTADLSIDQVFIAINCVYIPTLTLRIPKPKCPYFYKGTVDAYWLGADDEPYVRFDITYKNEVDNQCQYEYNLLIGIPKFNCPIFREGYVGVESLPWNSYPYVEFEILDDAGRHDCAFQYTLRLFMPEPPPCPLFIEDGVEAVFIDGNGDPNIEFYINPSVDNTFGACEYNYYLRLEIPRSCPVFREGWVGVEPLPWHEQPRVEFEILDDAGRQDCAYLYALRLFMPGPQPCPVFNEDGVRAALVEGLAEPEIEFYIRPGVRGETDPCQFDYYLKLDLPDQCPKFREGWVGVESLPWNSPPRVEFEILDDAGRQDCAFQYALRLFVPELPPCPEFVNNGVTVSLLDPGAAPELQFEIQPSGDNMPGACAYLYALDLKLPKSCVPTFRMSGDGASGQVVLLNPGDPGYVDLRITRIGGPDSCDFEVYIKIGVPTEEKKLVKGNISADWASDCEGAPTLEVEISEPDADGNQTIDIDLKVPKAPDYIGESWTVENNAGQSLGTATSMVDTTGCRRKVGGAIVLNTAECPQPQAFTALPTAEFTANNTARNSNTPDAEILATVVKNLQLDRATGKPVNPEFYSQMRNFFKQIQEDDNE